MKMNEIKEKLLEQNLNTYFVSCIDKDYNIETVSVVPANPCCNGYSVAKAFTVTAIGLLYDKGLLTPDSLLTDILSRKYRDMITPITRFFVSVSTVRAEEKISGR